MNLESTNVVPTEMSLPTMTETIPQPEETQFESQETSFTQIDFERINSAIESGDSANVQSLVLQTTTLIDFFKFALKEKKISPSASLIKQLLHQEIKTQLEFTIEFFELSSKILNMMKMTAECKQLTDLMSQSMMITPVALANYLDALLKDGQFDEAERMFETSIQKEGNSLVS